MACVYTGWTWTRSVCKNAHVHILSALKTGVAAAVPFEVVGLDFDNGTEFLNEAVIEWASKRIFFTRSRPYKKNDQAAIESKNGHLVRTYAFYYRHDTTEERAVLNRLWRLKRLCVFVVAGLGLAGRVCGGPPDRA